MSSMLKLFVCALEKLPTELRLRHAYIIGLHSLISLSRSPFPIWLFNYIYGVFGTALCFQLQREAVVYNINLNVF
jgi:hypothetical protein